MRTPDRKQTILIVDDEPTNIKVMSEVVPAGNTILFATNGQEALRIANSKTPDLILLDIGMPGMDGYETCVRLKADARTRGIPVVFVTIMNEVEDETKGLELGAIDYIRKPFSPAIVRARVKNHLELKKRRDMLENLSSIDGLTGIPNRSRFEEIVDLEWRRALRRDAWLSLILMDIDQFSSFNRKYGNVAGDDCLKMVARVLTKTFRRAADFVARYGEDVFAALLPETDAPAAERMGETLRARIADLRIEHPTSDTADCISMSVGMVSLVPMVDSSHIVLTETAEKTLRKAKQAGGSQTMSTVLESKVSLFL
jgi:diguanylate cyclase (GGDEF)-like protein